MSTAPALSAYYLHPMRWAIAALLLATLCACGGADPDDVDQLSAALRDESQPLGMAVDDEQADCVARLYLESDLSDEALDAITNGQPPAPNTTKDTEILRDLADKIADDCFTDRD